MDISTKKTINCQSFLNRLLDIFFILTLQNRPLFQFYLQREIKVEITHQIYN